MLYLILILIALGAVVTAFFAIQAEQNKRRKANEKWEEFTKKHPPSSDTEK